MSRFSSSLQQLTHFCSIRSHFTDTVTNNVQNSDIEEGSKREFILDHRGEMHRHVQIVLLGVKDEVQQQEKREINFRSKDH